MDSGGRETYVVLWDGGCGLCSRSVAWLRRLDVRRRLDYVDFTSEWDTLARTHASLAYDDCVRAMHVVAPDGRITAGFDGFRTLARAIPPLWPLLPLLYVPGVPPIGRRAYDFIARHRATTCTVPPPRPRQN